MNETVEQIRDRLLPVVQSYAEVEGLSEVGKIQAALRFGIRAGMNAQRGTDARIAESIRDTGVKTSNGVGFLYRATPEGIAKAIREASE